MRFVKPFFVVVSNGAKNRPTQAFYLSATCWLETRNVLPRAIGTFYIGRDDISGTLGGYYDRAQQKAKWLLCLWSQALSATG
jgi:hypothetical protein